ncbi:hypothetical protein KI688_010582 [Linnemannia hyalina]|uniref:Uncharacterized protein n=1 Tax=Linnemannia hyalina TaxID=64524 RepID=A0A9P7XWA3_9FUNG|nr:hypothetical protein KI688_010582 [Linnemannia hyalina]
MRSAITLLALAVLMQVRACRKIGVYGCIDVNTNCALLKGCVNAIDPVCVNFPKSLNDKMNSYLGGKTQIMFYEHYDYQGAKLESSRWRDVPNGGSFRPAPYAKQVSSVMINYYTRR